MCDRVPGSRWVAGALLVAAAYAVCGFLVPPAPTSLHAETLAEVAGQGESVDGRAGLLGRKGIPSYGGRDAAVVVERCRIRLRHDVQLAGERRGILTHVARVGDRVEKDAVVARLNDEVARQTRNIADVEAANDVEIRFARKKAELAELKYLRAVKANRDAAGTVPELELRQLRLDAEQSLLQLEQSEHQHAVAGLRRDEQDAILKTYRVVAPFTGVVVDVLADPGQVVAEGEPILELANVDVLEVQGLVPLDRVHLATVGTRAIVSLELVDATGQPRLHEFPAVLTTVDVRVEPLSRRVSFTADVANRNGLLRDGLVGTLTIPTPGDLAEK
jgi:multidrug efflux pump subunit AcrA (membrane-fusion protein)